ncbi:unnamed protein product [Thlaspi arvense]|uniref:RING-type E3 ubiquitin transferase n=1 Tax=Thlaspi arvense TaxID=13288 RepID=A0AAU9TB87_THLAR|nr:unnamed protein product [Thlaspi arvense]
MVFIISLFFFCLGIAAIAFLHFLAAGRRRSSLLSIDSPSTAVSYSPEEIQKSLPGANYTGGGSSEKECAVCLENFAAGDWCRSLPACRHMFHASCVDKWLVKAANCPVCRTRVRLDHGSIRSDMGDDERDLLWAIRV